MSRFLHIAAISAALAVAACGPGARAGGEGASDTPSPVTLWSGVVLRPERIVLANRRGIECAITYPAVSGAPTPALGEALQKALSLGSVLGIPLDEAREEISADDYLCYDIGYSIRFRREHLLDVGYQLEVHAGGQFRYAVRNRLVDLRTGERLTAERVFRPSTLPALAGELDRRLQAEIAKAIARDPDNDDWRFHDDQGARRHFRVEDLDNLSIDERGATFYFEYGFPHPGPDGPADFFLPWNELRPYLRPDGPLAPLLRRR